MGSQSISPAQLLAESGGKDDVDDGRVVVDESIVAKEPVDQNQSESARIDADEPTQPTESAPRKVTLKGLKKSAESGAVEGFDTKILLNTLKVYSSVFSALGYHPGGDDQAGMVRSARRLMEEIGAMSAQVASAIGVDPLDPNKQWVVGTLKTFCAEQVSSAWRRSHATGEDFSPNALVPSMREVLRMDAVSGDRHAFPDISSAASIQLSRLKAITPIMSELKEFEAQIRLIDPSTAMNTDGALSHLVGVLTSAASSASDRVMNACDSGFDHKTATVVNQAMLNHCGALMVTALHNEVDRAATWISSLPEGKRVAGIKKTIDQHPAFLNPALIEVKFQRSLESLAALAELPQKVLPQP